MKISPLFTFYSLQKLDIYEPENIIASFIIKKSKRPRLNVPFRFDQNVIYINTNMSGKMNFFFFRVKEIYCEKLIYLMDRLPPFVNVYQ